MQDVVVGIVVLFVGVLFCFRGYIAMRIIIPVWGAFAGFFLGAGLVASFANEGFLGSVLAWIVGAAVALVFAFIAYLYYEISVMIAMASIGFTLGASAMVALNVSWSWLIVLVGVIVGALLAFVAIAADLPTALLVLLSAMAGASATVAGIMLIVGTLSVDDFGGQLTDALDEDWWWWLVYVGVGAAGLIAQISAIQTIRGSMREAWLEQGGHTMRG